MRVMDRLKDRNRDRLMVVVRRNGINMMRIEKWIVQRREGG